MHRSRAGSKRAEKNPVPRTTGDFAFGVDRIVAHLCRVPGDPSIMRPIDLARSVRGGDGLVWLDSSMAGPGRRSFVGWDPREILAGGPGDWPEFERELNRRACEVPAGGDPCAAGAAVGWVSFDGSFRFGIYPRLAVFDHQPARWISPPEEIRVEKETPSHPPGDGPAFASRVGGREFCAMVARAKEYIAAGDIYQVCLSHMFEAEWAGDPWSYYERLRRVSPAPYGAYLDLGGVQIASASPECFLKMDGRSVETRPIKGTRPRHADPAGDALAAAELLASPKESAELVMITDLERNDLGQVCEFGSVHVADLLRLEQFAQVHHLVSTVRGTLRPDVTHASALRACFPGGSISGAPKKRALEIIAELEHTPRSFYTGAIGYFGFGGTSEFSIAIRTAEFSGGRARFGVGAGIVADSEPEAEWRETLQKAAGLLAAAR